MLNAIMGRKGHELHKFNIKKTRDWEEKFYTQWHRTTELSDLSYEMINENKEELHQVMNQLVAERFGIHHSCYTNFCGSEFPEFTQTNPNTNGQRRFTNSNANVSVPSSTQKPATAKEAKGAKVFDGWDCTPGAEEFGRTCVV